mgnify:CR=1 FL=1
MSYIIIEGVGKVGFKLFGQQFPKWLRRMFEGGKSSPFRLVIDLPAVDAFRTIKIPGPFDADVLVSQALSTVYVSITLRLDAGPVVWSFAKAVQIEPDPVPFRFSAGGARIEGTLRFEPGQS